MNDQSLVFSQHLLQDYLDCRRRFQLRYLQQLSWPAEQTSDQLAFEQHIKRGNDFHRMIQQNIIGIPEEMWTRQQFDSETALMWQIFKDQFPQISKLDQRDHTALYLPEHSLRGWLGDEQLYAKYDLLIVHPGKSIHIYDWKTTKSRIDPQQYLLKAQTRVYLWLAVNSGSQWFDGAAVPADHVRMTYWSPAHPDDPLEISYDVTRFQTDTRYLAELINEIRTLHPDEFDKTEDLLRCRFCDYRSLCQRGTSPGSLQEFENRSDTSELDINSIEAIEY